jgi:hypothetical protein
VDPTIDEYEIESEECIDGECVSSMFSLSRNGLFEVDDSNFERVKCRAKSLGNVELCEQLKEFKSEGEE